MRALRRRNVVVVRFTKGLRLRVTVKSVGDDVPSADAHARRGLIRSDFALWRARLPYHDAATSGTKKDSPLIISDQTANHIADRPMSLAAVVIGIICCLFVDRPAPRAKTV